MSDTIDRDTLVMDFETDTPNFDKPSIKVIKIRQVIQRKGLSTWADSNYELSPIGWFDLKKEIDDFKLKIETLQKNKYADPLIFFDINTDYQFLVNDYNSLVEAKDPKKKAIIKSMKELIISLNMQLFFTKTGYVNDMENKLYFL